MWEWIVRLFSSSQPEPLNRPKIDANTCGSTLDSPDMQQVREIQHDADNVISGIRGRRQIEDREARRRLLDIQSNPRGIGRE